MKCTECGAHPPGKAVCLDHFHALLAAEIDSEELRGMHGLTVLTYHLQHPSLTKPWYQVYGADVMRRVFGQGENWVEVLLEAHPRGVGRRQSVAAVNRLKAKAGSTMPDWVVSRPISGELTVVTINPAARNGHADAILAWSRSVATHRYLDRQDR